EYTKREKTLTLLFGFAFRGMLLECQGCMNEQEGRLLMIEYMDLVRQARRGESKKAAFENWFIQMGMHGFGRGNNNALSSERNNSNRKKRKMSGYNNVAKSYIDFVDGLEQNAATMLSSFN
ncbi:hypothetical protein Tco_1118992, partial [Tanacetum coccineum]